MQLPLRSLAVLLAFSPLLAAQDAAPLRVFLRAGPKTHGPGQHDHPRFLADWTELLRARGAVVDGGLAFPDAEQLAAADVLVMYAADAGSIHGAERARLEAWLAAGGGIVALHDAVCGDDPQWFKTIVGGAWEHGHSKWKEGEMGLYFADREHPITRGASNFDFDDEVYWDLHLAPEAHVLATGFHTVFDVTPQMWTYEAAGHRAFVSIQGHNHASFSHPAWRTLLLRGIAWAGGREADLFVSADEVRALRYPEGGPQAPERAHEGLVLHDDFELALVAAEPLIQNPISIDWDPRGRTWVACTPGYPYKQESSGVPAHDYVAILEDTDGDGRLDTRTLFHEGLDLVTSLVLFEDGAIVTQAPDILFLRDTDGDDRADTVETLYTGFGYSDTHATISNLRWGMDGWIYGTQGYSGNGSEHVLGHARGESRDFGKIGNGVFRFRPDGSAIEVVSSYGSNTWGLDFDWDGELFFTMANGSHARHVVLPESVLARGRIGGTPSWTQIVDHHQAFPISKHDRSPYRQIDFVGGFTAAAGCLIYNGGAWPDAYRGDHFVCEPTINLVHRDDLRPEGVTYRASKPREAEFLSSTDLWFRPVHVRTGPDGAMYVLDFYNQAAVHNDTRGPQHGPTNAAVRPDRDALHGRIWRVQHESPAALSAAPFDTQDDLVAALLHENREVRTTAQRLLTEGAGHPGAIPALERLAGLDFVPAAARVHALWSLWALHGLSEGTVQDALADPDAGLRKNGAILAGLSGEAPVEGLVALLEDPSPRVRLAAVVALGERGPDAGARVALASMFGELDDAWTRSAVLGAAASDPVAFAAECLDAERPERARAIVDELAERAGRDRDPERAAAFVRVLAARPEAPADLLESALRALSGASRPDARPAWSAEVAADLDALLAHPEPRVSIAALPLAARWSTTGESGARFEELADRLTAILVDPESDWELSLASLDALLDLPEHRAAAARSAAWMLAPYHPLDYQVRAIESLGGTGDEAAEEVLVAAYAGLSREARDEVFEELVQRPAAALRLLESVAEGALARNDLGPGRVFQLKTHADPEVARRAGEVFAAPRVEKDALLARLTPIVQEPGDVLAGAELFRQNCGTCHVFRGEGAEVGPALDGMGAHGPLELLPFVVDPNRTVEASYLEYAIRTTAGLNHAGVLVEDGPDSVVLRSADGDARVRREEIDELWSTGRTPMPEGFEELGDEAVRDILAYLCADYSNWRVLDLDPVTTTSTTRGLYDTREPVTYEFVKRGMVEVDGVPFEILDPTRTESGGDVVVLKGAMNKDWDSWTDYPRRVEVPVGFALGEVHVLGGVAAWGFPFTREAAPACRWTWMYADGTEEQVVLEDGDQFADWIRRHDVPGSRHVPGVLRPGSRGQLRTFQLAPSRGEVVRSIVLESFENHLAPTFLALTARLGAAPDSAPDPAVDVLVVGGGSSHDFETHVAGTDVATLSALGFDGVRYTSDPREVARRAAGLELLVLSNNQPLGDDAHEAVRAHLARGRGLLLVHAATWFNWSDRPDFNRELVGGGSHSHETYREFEVRVNAPDSPLTAGLPPSFRITDELYRFERDPEGPEIEVLLVGRSLETGAEYPVAWTVAHPEGRIVVTTLGHDGAAHEHAAFERLLSNAARWSVSD